ncbi:putative epoxide hydrolase [Poronia punctata]|nr:putative epoxide hydrolase [Poronia punctata]
MSQITEHDVLYSNGQKKIHYFATGPSTGPLIIFIHGFPGSGITWKAQLSVFSSLGFRAIAPDMPGYGESTARHEMDDYSQESLVEGMNALLSHTNRDAAIWVGHDWGAPVVSSVATQFPEKVHALITLCVPFHSIERGWKGFLPYVNRELYPVGEYEYGQWDYMKNWEENFEDTVAVFNKDIAGVLKGSLQKNDKAPETRFAGDFANVRKKGWFGGMDAPPPVSVMGPPILPEDVYDAYVKAVEKHGFWAPAAYYMNHERNEKYNTADKLRGGKLEVPVLFVHAAWDLICDTKTSSLPEGMRRVCTNLTEVTVEAGHFLQYEKPAETNAALLRFIAQEVPTRWPGYWDSGYVKKE